MYIKQKSSNECCSEHHLLHNSLKITHNYKVFAFQMGKKNIPSIFLPDTKKCGIFKPLGCDRNDWRPQYSILQGKLLFQFSTEVGLKKWGFRSLKSCNENFGLYQLYTTHIALEQCWETSCCWPS